MILLLLITNMCFLVLFFCFFTKFAAVAREIDKLTSFSYYAREEIRGLNESVIELQKGLE